MKHIRNFLLSGALLLSVGLVATPALASAATAAGDACAALGAGSDCSKNPSGSTSVNSVLATAINIMSFIVGVIAVIMIIVGGLKFVTSGGDANNVSAAKNTILYAIVGLVVVALAQAIVRFVLHKAV
jgi:hypothetical protein